MFVVLQRLTRFRYQLVHQQTECKQHFLENLYYKCNFYDEINDRCGIHSVRPSICRAFGYYNNLLYFRNPKLALASRRNYMASSYPVGILSVDFTWNDFT
ncbi:YkgJ family cysteine cluster protein [Bacillus mobilis]|uniref:YkgJ family cysteine cluster protein n=1 Tax=Bacillus mobilis TaxID=2026190 RepID=UPI002EBA1BD2|nr:YkgJ family cysteine cluster protein [Bacillus mobilis]MED0998691.1 YkgJ family cysteine cluster protein [Bacillus mobilis]MED1003025.1 YkgJ family cysteine cluster protein [Bacillus mobilis]